MKRFELRALAVTASTATSTSDSAHLLQDRADKRITSQTSGVDYTCR